MGRQRAMGTLGCVFAARLAWENHGGHMLSMFAISVFSNNERFEPEITIFKPERFDIEK
jgi:hypothetical protein